MRKVQVLFAVLVASFLVVGTTFANSNGMSPDKNLRAEIISLIDQPVSSFFSEESLVANLKLMVNGNHELIVIDTGTENEELDSYLKSKLNYKKVNASDILHFNFYCVKVEFKK